jgi:hypothetical protein
MSLPELYLRGMDCMISEILVHVRECETSLRELRAYVAAESQAAPEAAAVVESQAAVVESQAAPEAAVVESQAAPEAAVVESQAAPEAAADAAAESQAAPEAAADAAAESQAAPEAAAVVESQAAAESQTAPDTVTATPEAAAVLAPDAGKLRVARNTIKNLEGVIRVWNERASDSLAEAKQVLRDNDSAAMVWCLTRMRGSDNPVYSFLKGWVPPMSKT